MQKWWKIFDKNEYGVLLKIVTFRGTSCIISVDWSLLKAGTTLHSAPAFRTAPAMTLADPSSVSKSCNKVSIGESADGTVDGTADGMDRQVERTWCPRRNPSRARPFQGRTPLCTEGFSTLTVTLCLTAGNQVSPSPQAASVMSESRAGI